METINAADVYLESAIETAPPAKLVRMLTEGAVRFLDRGTACSPATERVKFVNGLQRARAIVTELRLALIPCEGSDVAPQLDRLYLFCEDRIGQSLTDSSPEPAREAHKVLATLLDAWQKIEIDAGQAS
jgi:flagellar protein FliS